MAVSEYVLPSEFEAFIGEEFSLSTHCLHINIRSAKNKRVDLECFFAELSDFEIIMLSETWYTEHTDVFRLPLYQCFFINRSETRGGGVSILIKESVDCELVPSFTVITKDYEALSLRTKNDFVVVIYHPHAGALSPFLIF